jgi:hypothetical protein
MDLNVKLQGLKFNYKKVLGCFCKILRFHRFLGFMKLFSLRKICRICPQHRGPGPLAPAHRSTDFIKHRLLLTGMTAQIKPIELVCWLPISVVHRRSDGWLRPGRRCLTLMAMHHGRAWRLARVLVFSSYGGRFSMRFAPTGSKR